MMKQSDSFSIKLIDWGYMSNKDGKMKRVNRINQLSERVATLIVGSAPFGLVNILDILAFCTITLLLSDCQDLSNLISKAKSTDYFVFNSFVNEKY